MHEHGVRQDTLRAIALASYHYAQANPRAVMYGKPLDPAKYDASRRIAEPFHLYDCCMENNGAAALVLAPAERAGEFRSKPVYVLGAAVGSGYRTGAMPHNSPLYASASFDTVAPDLYRMAGLVHPMSAWFDATKTSRVLWCWLWQSMASSSRRKQMTF